MSENSKVEVVECDSDQWEFIDSVKDRAEQKRSGPEWSGITLEWKGIDNKSGGTTLALACVLCLDLLSRM